MSALYWMAYTIRNRTRDGASVHPVLKQKGHVDFIIRRERVDRDLTFGFRDIRKHSIGRPQ